MDYYDEITKTQEAARMATFAKMVGDGIAQNLFSPAFAVIADKKQILKTISPCKRASGRSRT